METIPKNETIIAVRDLVVTRDTGFVLRVPALDVRRGERLCVFGLNGSGKTTLLQTLAHLVTPSQGAVFVNGAATTTLTARTLAQRIALVEQDCHYVFPYSVLEVVLMGRFAHHRGTYFESDEDVAIAERALVQTGLTRYRDTAVTHLSGGERRRVEIARALAQETDIILFDEPTAFLDVAQQRTFETVFNALHEAGKTLVMVTHTLDLVRRTSDRIAIMRHGELVRVTDVTAAITNDDIERWL